MMSSLYIRSVCYAGYLILTGCAGLISQPAGNVPVEEPGSLEIRTAVQIESESQVINEEFIGLDSMQADLPEQVSSSISQPPAIVALLDDARQQQQQGQLPMAAASIERAIRLQPNNPLLWTRLAQIRLAERNWQQAYVLANKSISLSRTNRELQQLNWAIIEQAKDGQGDKETAQYAREQMKLLMDK